MEPWLQLFASANFLRSADTAHDLKTPLNVAVLNLELLRMRIRKLNEGEDDKKILEYTAAIEMELRRMAEIFDNFFLLSTPPRADDPPVAVDISPFLENAGDGPLKIICHEARIQQAFRLLFDSAAKLFTGTHQSAIARNGDRMTLTITGDRPSADFEPTKLFKFYYTDQEGHPDLSMATARLIFETYGGVLNATEESDKVAIRLSLPLGEQ